MQGVRAINAFHVSLRQTRRQYHCWYTPTAVRYSVVASYVRSGTMAFCGGRDCCCLYEYVYIRACCTTGCIIRAQAEADTDMIRTYVELRVEPQLQSCDTIYHCRARYPMDTLWHTTNPSTGTTLVDLGHSKGRHEGVATPEQAPLDAHINRACTAIQQQTRGSQKHDKTYCEIYVYKAMLRSNPLCVGVVRSECIHGHLHGTDVRALTFV